MLDLSANQAVVSPTNLHLSPDGAVWVADPGAALIHRWASNGVQQQPISLAAGELLIEPVLITGLSDSAVAVWDRGRAEVLVLNPYDLIDGESYILSLATFGTAVLRGMGSTANDLILWVEVFPDEYASESAVGSETVLLVGLLKAGGGFEQIGQPVPGARVLYYGLGAERRGIYAAGSRRHHVLVTGTDVLLANSETGALDGLLGRESLLVKLEPLTAFNQMEAPESRRWRVGERAVSDATTGYAGDTVQRDLVTSFLDSLGRGLYDHAFVDVATGALWFVRQGVDSEDAHLLLRRDGTTGAQGLFQFSSHGQLRAIDVSGEAIATLEESSSGRYLLRYSILSRAEIR